MKIKKKNSARFLKVLFVKELKQHLSSYTLSQYINNQLVPLEKELIQFHLARCKHCKNKLNALLYPEGYLPNFKEFLKVTPYKKYVPACPLFRFALAGISFILLFFLLLDNFSSNFNYYVGAKFYLSGYKALGTAKIEKAIKLNPHESKFYYLAGDIYYKKGAFRKAREYYFKAFSLNHSLASPNHNFAPNYTKRYLPVHLNITSSSDSLSIAFKELLQFQFKNIPGVKIDEYPKQITINCKADLMPKPTFSLSISSLNVPAKVYKLTATTTHKLIKQLPNWLENTLNKLTAITLIPFDRGSYFVGKIKQEEDLILFGEAKKLYLKFTPEDNKKAINMLEKLVKSSSGFPLAYSLLADCYAQEYLRWSNLNSFYLQKATHNAQVALTEAPYLPQVHKTLGLLYIASGQLKRAEREFREAIQIDENFIPAYIALAKLLDGKGEKKESEALYIKTQQIDPYSPYVWAYYGVFLLKENRLKESITALKKSLDLMPEFDLAKLNLALAYQKFGQLKEAEAILINLINQPNPREEVYYYLAKTKEKEGELEDAIKLYKTFIEKATDKNSFLVKQAQKNIIILKQRGLNL